MTIAIRTTLALLAALAGPALAQGQPEQKPPGCQFIQFAALPLSYAGSPLEITVGGTINGKPARMMIDTGGYGNVLTTSGVLRHHLKRELSYAYAVGIGGRSDLYVASVKDFSIGPSRGTGAALMDVLDQSHGAVPYDAIVGAPFLLQADMEISLAAKELKFFSPQDCKDAFLAYWDRNAVVVPFLNGPSRNPRFTVEVNGRKLKAMIDTGATSSAIELDAAAAAGLVPKEDAGGASYAVGIGERAAGLWRAHVDSFAIGNERIESVDINVIDTGGRLSVDVVLGADFLRAHRVLFAMSQRRLYLSYVDGNVFGTGSLAEPWLRAEAEHGNGDAQLLLASAHAAGRHVPKDPVQSRAWLDKAIAQGHPGAHLKLGREMFDAGRYAEAAALLSVGVSGTPTDNYAPLQLYLARLGSDQEELGRRELAASLERDPDRPWPAPIGDFYLKRIKMDALSFEVEREPRLARRRNCEATFFQAELQRAQGNAQAAAQLKAAARTACPGIDAESENTSAEATSAGDKAA
jgi:clan AA aspartic protease (TIGR02281 family)